MRFHCYFQTTLDFKELIIMSLILGQNVYAFYYLKNCIIL